MNKEFLKNNRFIIAIILITIVFITIFGIRSISQHKEIAEFGKTYVAKYVSFKKYPKSTNYYFIFYDNDIKKKCYVIDMPNNLFRNTGKFYNLKYLEKYPDLIIVNFDKEVTDTSKIFQAGFSQKDYLDISY